MSLLSLFKKKTNANKAENDDAENITQGSSIDGSKPSKNKKDAGKNKYDVIFTRDFVIGIIEIEKKNIKSFILNEAINYLQTDDFYSGYIYENGCLKYLAHKSNKHETGKVSKLSPVLMKEGNYFILIDNNSFHFRNKNNTIDQIVEYPEFSEDSEENRKNVINLDRAKFDKIPPSLVLKWSLEKKNYFLNGILSLIAAASLSVLLIAGNQYESLTKKAQIIKSQLQDKTKAGSVTTQLTDISQPIRAVAKVIGDRGTIASAKGEKNTLVFAISMKTENDVRTYINENGGTYENGKIIFGAKYSSVK